MDKNRNQFKSEAIDISSLSRTDLECFLNELGWNHSEADESLSGYGIS